MDTPIKSFCDQVSTNGQLYLQKCGIDRNNQFFYSHSVAATPDENRRLLIEMSKHPVLSHLTSRTIVARQDVTPFYAPVPQAVYPPQAAVYSHGYATPHAGFGVPAYPSAVSNPAPYAGFGVPAYPSAMSAPAPQTGFGGPTYASVMSTPATGGRFSASSSAGTFSTTPGAVGGTGSAYTASAPAFTPFSSVSTTTPLSSYVTSTSTPAGHEKVLPGGVTLVTYNKGVLGYAENKNSLQQSYALVSSVDLSMSFDRGIAKALADKVGSHYTRVSQQNPMAPGECFTYKCTGSQPAISGLSNCKNIHNVSVPLPSDPNYQETLKNAFVNLFEEAKKHGSHVLYCCFIGCGHAGGTGQGLAQALHHARCEFFKNSGATAPDITLVGQSTSGDQQIYNDFMTEWTRLTTPEISRFKQHVAPGTAYTYDFLGLSLLNKAIDVPSAALATAVSGCTHAKTLIPGMLDVVMHPDKGMFGVGKVFSKKREKFDLVNAANHQMDHAGGVAKEFVDRYGKAFSTETANALRANPIRPGGCLTINIKNSRFQPPADLTGVENIHNVVAPMAGHPRYDETFKEAFVALLTEAANRNSKQVISCFIGCAIFGGNGAGMAKALHAAYHSTRIPAHLNMPQLVLAGWDDGSSGDKKVYDDFIKEFENLQKINPVNRSSGKAKSAAVYSSSGTGAGYSTGGAGAAPIRPAAYSGTGMQKADKAVWQSFPLVDLSKNSSPVTPVTRAKGKPAALSQDKTPKTSITGTSGKIRADFQNPDKQDVMLQGDGKLGCYNGTLTKDDLGFIEDGIKNNKFKLVQIIPAKDAYEKNKDGESEPVEEPVLMMPLKDFQYGQLLSYQAGNKTRYFSVDTVRGEYKAKGCFICPVTSQLIFGVRTGDQPADGTMSSYVDRSMSLPGYEGYGAIVIDYHFPDGTQSREHRNPGARYTGTSRRAYLPNNQEGQHVFELLKTAFKNRLTFTVGTSVTLGSGGGDRVTWNDIHHKTSTHGGAAGFGYPDNGYLQRVKDELKAKGIE